MMMLQMKELSVGQCPTGLVRIKLVFIKIEYNVNFHNTCILKSVQKCDI